MKKTRVSRDLYSFLNVDNPSKRYVVPAKTDKKDNIFKNYLISKRS